VNDKKGASLMTTSKRIIPALAALAAAISASASVQAQTYGAPASQQPPLYPYAVASQQPYAVEVAPNTYVIQRPQAARNRPYVTCVNCGRATAYAAPAPSAPVFDRTPRPSDPALIEELRRHTEGNTTVIDTKKIVREKPIVHETTRVVDDPPRVIVRKHIVEDAPQNAEGAKEPRVIQADAEITILGPDRMSIRLLRKRGEPEAQARPGE